MIGPEIQKAIHDALQAQPPVAGGRVFDSVPRREAFPYVTIGEEQIVDDGNSCGEGWDVFADVHVWSRKPGFPEAKVVASTVAERIRGIPSIPGFSLVSVEIETVRFSRDPDGLTSHGIVTAHFIIDQA